MTLRRPLLLVDGIRRELQDGEVLKGAEVLPVAVKNSTGALIAKGSVVYISGASGSYALITKAQGNTEAASSKTLGLLFTDIANNGTGYAIPIGRITGLDTSAYVVGNALWLSPTVAGGWTTVKPIAPNHAVFLGNVIVAHATQGEVQVNVQNGYELEELHDVLISSLANGHTLVWDAVNSLWRNQAPAGGGAGGGDVSTISTGTDLVASGYQRIRANDYEIQGDLTLEGDLVIL